MIVRRGLTWTAYSFGRKSWRYDELPAEATDREQILRDFVEWFDRWYPPGCAVLPGVPLWRLAERARELLAVSNEVDEPGERDQ